ncbi:hypothetical protein [Microbulbifer agarilyticus]
MNKEEWIGIILAVLSGYLIYLGFQVGESPLRFLLFGIAILISFPCCIAVSPFVAIFCLSGAAASESGEFNFTQFWVLSTVVGALGNVTLIGSTIKTFFTSEYKK